MILFSCGKNKVQSNTSQVSSSEIKQRGQIVIEYVLILIVVVSMAVIVVDGFVKRSNNPDDQGFIIRAWSQLLFVIGSDT